MLVESTYNPTPPVLAPGATSGFQMDVNGNLKVNEATVIDPLNDKVTAKPYGTSWVENTSSALIRTGATILVGYFVNTFTATASIKFWDNTAGSGTTLGVPYVIPALGWVPMGNMVTATGLYLTISGTADVTVVYADPTSQS